MKRDYWNLNVSEFIEVIAEVAEHRAYSVTLSNGIEMRGTLEKLSSEAIKYQNPELTNAVAEIRRNPIYQYEITSFAEIIDYVDRWTQHYDPDRLRAFWVDAFKYFYSDDKFDGTTAGAEKVQYLKRFLASKIDGNTGGDSVAPVADQFELPDRLITRLDSKQVKALFDWLRGGGFIGKNTDYDSFAYAFGVGSVDEYRPIVWKKTKQLLRELLERVATDSKSGIERKVRNLFVDKSNNAYSLAKPKKVPNEYSDKLNTFLKNLFVKSANN